MEVLYQLSYVGAVDSDGPLRIDTAEAPPKMARPRHIGRESPSHNVPDVISLHASLTDS